jgi:4-hydroxy-tetrahydrodipicolinate reductase
MMRENQIKIIQLGMGPLGKKVYQYAIERKSLQVVGAVDMNPEMIGKDVGLFCNRPEAGIQISGTIQEVLNRATADVVVITTVSDMERITPQVEEIAKLGLPIVSTCEELSYPYETSPELARHINDIAKENGVAVLGTGINPGFLMDSLPAFLSGICKSVEKVEVNRFQDAQYRRIPFQQKIGAGLDLDAYELKKKSGTLRHVGLTESLHFVAGQLGWKLDSTEDVLSPVIANQKIETKDLTILPGQAAGVNQIGNGYVNGEVKVKLTFQAAVGEPESYDEVIITGEPNIHSRISGGVNGDIATCAITLNAIHSILNAQPGLRTMSDVPMVSCRD